jgi:hypothetical protein
MRSYKKSRRNSWAVIFKGILSYKLNAFTLLRSRVTEQRQQQQQAVSSSYNKMLTFKKSLICALDALFSSSIATRLSAKPGFLENSSCNHCCVKKAQKYPSLKKSNHCKR